MVAQNIRLPNIRKIFIPDVGYVIVDSDLAGADAQVVAWEAGDERLKQAFKSGAKIHILNARDTWPERTANLTDDELKATGDAGGMYYEIKRAVHGTNYGASPGALVSALGWSEYKACEFQERWFYLHPEIREWHLRIERYLDGSQCWNCDNLEIKLGARGRCDNCEASLGRTVKNRFGFRRIFFDRVDGSLLPEALAWCPQSTVNFCVELGWINIVYGHKYSMLLGHGEVHEFDWSQWLVCPDAGDKWRDLQQFLLQVHDSIVFQVKYRDERYVENMVSDMRVIVPYSDPLIIPMSVAKSRISWGDCK